MNPPSLLTAPSSLDFPPTVDGDYARRYLAPILSQGPQTLIRNVYNTQMMLARVDDVTLPVTTTDFHLDNTYTVSPYSHYISYGGYEEVRNLNKPFVERLVKLILQPVAANFRNNDFDRVAFVNNWLLSTNLYPAMTETQIEVLADALPQWFPDRAVIFRSVDAYRNPLLFDVLQRHGYEMMLSRQVWYMPPEAATRTRQFKEDARVLRDHGYEIVENQSLTDGDLERILVLYEMLYLKKYSYFNPQFTLEFLKLARDEETLYLRAIRSDGRIDAAMGFFVRNGVMTQPLFGYDTSLPEQGLYRLLTLITLQEGLQRGLLVHASGGVGKFKKVRGGVSTIEYNAVFMKHLPKARQRPWKLIQAISKYAIPYFQKNDF
jgi:hypothetical protein